MFFTAALSLFLGLGSSLVAASPVSSGFNATARRRECGNTPSKELIARAESHFAENRVMVDAYTSISIPVCWHVIHKNDTIEGGNIPDSQILASIKVLNKDYLDCGVQFYNDCGDRTQNSDWFDNAGPDSGTDKQTAMKTYLRRGKVDTLNVYTVGFTNYGLIGYGSYPWLYRDNPTDDGVVIKHSTVPGGTLDLYNLGRTLTHEVGHWVGLYHPFDGGCDGGDQVDDTPPENNATFYCTEAKNTCPQYPKTDPVDNFMDYAYDACMTTFTPGQCTRMREQISTYRSIGS